jgi:hypothetical protein
LKTTLAKESVDSIYSPHIPLFVQKSIAPTNKKKNKKNKEIFSIIQKKNFIKLK